MGEHLLCKQGVNGSIPFISTSGCAAARYAEILGKEFTEMSQTAPKRKAEKGQTKVLSATPGEKSPQGLSAMRQTCLPEAK